MQPPRTRQRTIAPLVRIAAVAVLVTLATTTHVGADADPLRPCATGLHAGITMPDASWRTVVDATHGFALRLPDGHVLSGGDGTWYVHGFLDDMPLVPDVAISFLADVTLDEAVARDHPEGAEVERIQLGPATTGARVSASYTAPDGTAYRQAGYLVETDLGVLRIDRYEGFDWDGFDALACSVHVVELLE